MATTQVQTVNTSADKVKLAASGAMVIWCLWWPTTRWPSRVHCFSGSACWRVWRLRWSSFYVGNRQGLMAFGQDSVREVKKVVWPARREAIQMTAYVFGFVLLMALFLWLTDKTLEWVFYDLILGWKS
jgi:preprotein translocase subunit SecE